MKDGRWTRVGWMMAATTWMACGPPPPSYEAPPAAWGGATVVPARPEDPGRPLERVVWTMGYDLRELDATLAWLRDEVQPSPERDRALGAAILLAAYELDRADLAEEGRDTLDAAITAFPDDDRLPVWRAMLAFTAAYRDGDRSGVAAAYDALRDATARYEGFTSFGLTLVVAADRDADAALIDEAVVQYERMNDAFMALQHDPDPLAAARGSRLGDWGSVPYNIAGTAALVGDMRARAGDVEGAVMAYYQASRSNTAPRWPFRAEVEARMEDAADVSARLAASPPEASMFGARFVGASGVDAPYRVPGWEGRIGNGSCTVCHTRLGVTDIGEPAAAVGWIRGTYVAPEGIPSAMPVFFALSEDAATPPGGFLIGRVSDDEAPAPTPAPGEVVEYVIPTAPGRWFVAGQVFDGAQVVRQGYTARELGMQRFLDVRAGTVTDIADSPPMELSPVE